VVAGEGEFSSSRRERERGENSDFNAARQEGVPPASPLGQRT